MCAHRICAPGHNRDVRRPLSLLGPPTPGRWQAFKAPRPGVSGFVPIRPLYRIEHAFAQLGRWRRLSRCYEGTIASARAWREVASVGYLVWRVSN